VAAGGVNGADEFAAELLAAAERISEEVPAVTRELAGEVLSGTVSRAPRDSGQYKGSWRSRSTARTDGFRVSLFTEDPAAARLEYGFHGRDSRGRVYDQAPRSHQRAAIDEVFPKIGPAFTALVQRAIRG